jgi:PAS domain S-box-containing protein
MAQNALRQSEEKYRVAFNSTPDAITITQIPDNRYVYVNDAFTKLTGYSRQEALGRTPFDLKLLVEPADRERLLRMLDETGEVSGYELRTRHKDGFTFDSLLSARKLHYENKECVFAVIKDITAVKEAERERARLEIQLHKAQKMEALGALSGGIAHDFNNILGAIWGFSELALISLPKDAAAREHLEEVVKACKRAKDLIMQILAFSSRKQRERLPVQVHLIINEVLELLRVSLPSTIEIRTNIIKEPDIVQADPTQIHQVIMNLCTNAFYAMSNTGGVLKVSLKPVNLDDNRPAGLSHIKPGPYLKLSIEDTGKGMKPEIIPRIFEPYFTTRPREQGTGLGLAVAQSIVTSLGGAIIAQSAPDKGSRFDVYFPLSDLPVETSSEMTENYPTGYERILFVDDEKPLVNLVRQMLESLDYHVVAASNAATAAAVFSEDPSAFDLVVTDLTMPGMTGFDLAHKIRDIRPDMPIVLMTGYSDQAADVKKLTRAGIRTVLIKPFTFRQLAATVKKALEPGQDKRM